ncbi:MAG: M4 family metallopeptidase [Verrucomicrobia bacterium]|nr:M4 family metallopeptidase [Verrucomicrobiota bacterium]MBV8485613.1 M4 family metallopeptidase [Verrucomicrobiota bacterium]
MCKRCPIHCILPPHVLHAMLRQEEDRRLRDAALRTLSLTIRMHERRNILGAIAVTAPAGQRRRTIYDAQRGSQLPGRLVRGEGDPPSSDASVNDAYDGLGATYDFFNDIFQRNSIDDRGMRLDASVHYSQDYDNAFWDGQQMVFGDGDGVIFLNFTKAVDVIGHELTHGVTQHTANLSYHNQSGALNESVSDVFGSLVKQYHNNQDVESADWLIGAGIMAPGMNATALRSMKDPGSAYDDPKLGGKDPQPKQMNNYVQLPDTEDGDFGGVHINSGIPNHAFYLIAEQLGGHAWERAGHIWYSALRQLWPSAQFSDLANITFEVAGTLFGAGSAEQQAVRDAWTQVGVAPAPLRRRMSMTSAKRAAVKSSETNGQKLKESLDRVSLEIQAIRNSLT